MAEQMDVEDRKGRRYTIDAAQYRRWPSVREEFRPVSEKAAPAVKKTPTGDKETEK